MFTPKLNLVITPRSEKDAYRPDLNPATLNILSHIFEFKIAAAIHLARFSGEKEVGRYLYTKLRRLWQAGLLESLQLYQGTRLGMPLYYMLSRDGLRVIGEHRHYDRSQLKTYQSPATLISSSLFTHEAEIVELASLEALAGTPKLTISFVGEMGAQKHDVLSDRRVEVLTPDYVAIYRVKEIQQVVYTEFERTNKSTSALVRKIERYIGHFSYEVRQHIILRLIFDNERLELSFWLHIVLEKPRLALNIHIITTNLTLTQTTEQFREPIYAHEGAVKLKKDGRLSCYIEGRVKMPVYE